MEFEQVVDNLTFKHIDALKKRFSLSLIMFGTTVFGNVQY